VLLEVSGFDFVGHGSVYVYGNKLTRSSLEIFRQNHYEKFNVELGDGLFVIENESGDNIKFFLQKHILELRKLNTAQVTSDNIAKLSLIQASKDGHFKAQLILEEVSGNVTADNIINLTRLEYVLMLKINE